MLFTVGLMALAGVVAFLSGGRGHGRVRLRLPWLVVGVILARVAAEAGGLDDRASLALGVASLLLLFGLATANLALVGMPIVVIGLLLNLAVIAVEGAMPVDRQAAVVAGLAARDDPAGEPLGAERRLADNDEDLTADIRAAGAVAAVPFLDEVVGFGDLILAAGLANVVYRRLRPPRLGRHSLLLSSGTPA